MENCKHYMAAGPLQSAGLSLICGELSAETGQANLFSVVKVSVVICQVMEKYFTGVKSINNRAQKRFPRNILQSRRKVLCVCLYMLGE